MVSIARTISVPQHLQQRLGLDFADAAQRFEGRNAIAELLEPWFAARTLSEAGQALETHKVCWGRYSTVGELLANDPRVNLANPVFERMTTPRIGEHLGAGATVRVAHMEREPTTPAALLGSHTDEVLHEVLGLDGTAVGKLRDAGVVAGPECDPSQEGRI